MGVAVVPSPGTTAGAGGEAQSGSSAQAGGSSRAAERVDGLRQTALPSVVCRMAVLSSAPERPARAQEEQEQAQKVAQTGRAWIGA